MDSEQAQIEAFYAMKTRSKGGRVSWVNQQALWSIKRQTSMELPPEERIQNFNEFHAPLHTDEQQAQGARCMDCGVPFCQSGMLLGGMCQRLPAA